MYDVFGEKGIFCFFLPVLCDLVVVLDLCIYLLRFLMKGQV